MAEYLAPGVYVEEIDTGSKPIEGVSTSIAGMLGVTERGPVNVPILVTSYGEYRRWFGERLNKADYSNGNDPHCYLPHAVEGFFTNGGKQVYVTRVLDVDGAQKAFADLFFDDGKAPSLSTQLLRRASEMTGTPAHLPLLYLLSDSGLQPGMWIRIGDGSNAEYKLIDTSYNATTPLAQTFLPLSLPLSRSHDIDTSIQVFTNSAGASFTLITPDGKWTQRGAQTITVQGAKADVTALATGQHLLEVGPAGQGEYRFIKSVSGQIDLSSGTQSQASVQLDSGLQLSYASNAQLREVTVPASFAATDHLGLPATAGESVVFGTNQGGAFTSSSLVLFEGGTPAQKEVRRIGNLERLSLAISTSEIYGAGSLVEAVQIAPDSRNIIGVADPMTLVLDNITGLLVGEKTAFGTEVRVIQHIYPATTVPQGKVTFATQPPPSAIVGASLTLAPRNLTAPISAGASILALDDRVGLLPGDVIAIDINGTTEYATIKALPGRAPAGTAPDAGNVLLVHPLSLAHANGSQVTRQIVSLLSSAAPTVTILDAPTGSTSLLVSDGTNYQNLFIRLTTSSGSLYNQVTATGSVTPALVPISTALERAHAPGAPVVTRKPLLRIEALDAGIWGNRLRISVEDEPAGLVSQTTLRSPLNATHIQLASAAGVEAGTILELLDPLQNNAVVGDPVKVQSIHRASNYTIVLDGAGLSVAQLNAQALAAAAGKALIVRSREFRLTVQLLRQPDPAFPTRNNELLDREVFRYLSMDPRHSRYIQNVLGDTQGTLRLEDRRPLGESQYVRVHDLAQDLLEPSRTTTLESVRLGPEVLVDILPTGRQQPARQALESGDDSIGTLSPDDRLYIGQDAPEPENRTGLYTFNSVNEISIVACPGRTGAAIQEALIAHCELLRYRFVVLDGPPPPADTLADVQAQRQQFDTKYAALYHPWLLIPDPFPTTTTTLTNYAIPPGGHVLGVYAHTDIERGVHKAPANEVVMGIVGLQRVLSKSEQDILNPYPVNINVIRDFRHDNRGIRIYGGRVITSDPDWKYVNVRRLLIFIEASLDIGLQWVVFEPNAEPLWARVRRVISNFLTVVWHNGALEGTKAEEAFFVRCDRSTMTQTDIDNGRLICIVGVAPVKPAEFVIVRIGLWTANAQN